MDEDNPKNSSKSQTALEEEKILKFWKENKIFEKTLLKKGKEFVFYDGPPFATGLPHHGSLLSSVIKDVVPRYKTMRGFRVRRRFGWDCHGLPIESLVEKELSLKTKKDIENIGVEAFNEKARSMVLRFVSDWEKYIERVGRFVDFKNSYKTMDNSYIESVWWGLKELWNKGLLYEGKKVLMYCTHCETPLAKAEIAMDNTYKEINEEAVTVKFKVKDPKKHGLPENTYFLAWTTTPWTLPGNVGLAVGENIEYVIIREPIEVEIQKAGVGIYSPKEESFLIISKLQQNSFDSLVSRNGQSINGQALVGIEYEPLYKIDAVLKHQGKKHLVLPADFVSTEEGTGLVHTAVMYGEDDYVLGEKERMPMVQLLEKDGTYNSQAPEFLRGRNVKLAEKEIIEDLEKRGLLLEKKAHTHSYPHCYRCGTPLIYNAVPSWFINIQKVKGKMVSLNEKINWIPGHLKHGRFRNIVENAPDWTISRNRFWASPLPIWKSDGGKVMVLGSLEEISKLSKKSGNKYFLMRHGESENNVKNIISSKATDQISLTEKGKKDVLETGKKLKSKKIDLVFSSPFLRTKDTAYKVAEILGVPSERIFIDERLSEINTGEFHGGPISEYHNFFASFSERFTKSPAQGENFNEIRKRVGDFLHDLEKSHVNKNILIVTHESPAFLMYSGAQGSLKEEIEKVILEKPDFLKPGEFRELSIKHVPKNKNYEVDLHRPYADDLILIDKDGVEYKRIPEVVDCWVESGSMPFSEWHYPFENKKEFEKRSPGDFIAEYIAQTRTWFYYMHAMGVLLFGRIAFKNVVSTGTILASNGEKISKSKNNYTDPLLLIDTYGADSFRFYLMSSSIMQGEDLNFKDEDVRDVHNQTVRMLLNSYRFYELYKNDLSLSVLKTKKSSVLDKWIITRLSELVSKTTEFYEKYDLPKVCREIKSFVDDYSTWYIRRSRDVLKGRDTDLKNSSILTQKEVLLTVSKVVAPVMPFLAENIYKGAGGSVLSVHLEDWPKSKKIDGELIKSMEEVRKIVSLSLELRSKAKIKVRQPLLTLSIPNKDILKKPELTSLIKEEVNVKDIKASSQIELDTKITDELRAEGAVRDFIREIQDKRKETNLVPNDVITIVARLPQEEFDMVNKSKDLVMTSVNAKEISFGIGERNIILSKI